MEELKACDYTGKDFGASYPDSICIDGYLWDMDSGGPDHSGEFDYLYTIGGELPCPKCNPAPIKEIILDHLMANQMIIECDFIKCDECWSWFFDDGFAGSPFCDCCGK